MKIANLNGRLSLLRGSGAVDVAVASGGRFAPEIQAIYARWDEFTGWAEDQPADAGEEYDAGQLGSPVPLPPQVFAIGLNYREHAAETGMELPAQPMVFTKFPASVSGPFDRIGLPPGRPDWETELVAVIGRRAEHVPEAEGWSYVAGLTVGQDMSERDLQMKASVPPQFNLGKSYAGFAPLGPTLVTPDEFADPDDIGISCALNGQTMQSTRTSDMIFSIPSLIAYISRILPLLPGDVIFTGTPSGIGARQSPPRFLGPDDVLTTSAELIGEMRHTFFTRPQ